jgi:hypothetical protein
MADEHLQRWARDRVPDLLRRAEEEALAEVRVVLRDALLEAALTEADARPGAPAGPRPAPAREPAPAPSPQPEPTGEVQWLYAVGRAGSVTPPTGGAGVHGAPVRLVEEGGLAALVSPVPLPQFGEAELTESLNDLRWLEEVARTHQGVVDAAFAEGPVVPLRLCSIYATSDRVRDLLREDGERFAELLAVVEGKQEWSVKLFADPAQLAAAAGVGDDPGSSAPADAGLGTGGAYLARRRSDRAAREAADRVAGELAEEVHARLQDWATDAVVGRPQNPELSGHSGDMLLNGAYLVDAAGAEPFAALVDELRKRYEAVGATLELSGPWPPYNFIEVDG